MTRMRLLFAAIFFFIFIQAGWAASWTKPTTEELAMTSQPEVPGAPAVYLYRREETRNLAEAANDADLETRRLDFCSTVEPLPIASIAQIDTASKKLFHTLYARVKVLNEAGVRYGRVDLVEPDFYFVDTHVEGRTIQPDGSEVPFNGVVHRRLISKSRYFVQNEVSFEMPAVRVGSIVEYRVTFKSTQGLPAEWFLQQDLFVRKAEYAYDSGTLIRRKEESGIGYTSFLPPGVSVEYRQSDRSYSLHAENMMPLKAIDYQTPLHDAGYHVRFHWACESSVAEFWGVHGKWWSSDVDHFVAVSKLKEVAAQIVSPGDTDEQKVLKLYAAVQGLENLSYAKDDALAEAEKTEMKLANAKDVWTRRQGSSEDLTLLFVGLCRALGLSADVAGVANRDRDLFNANDEREDSIEDYIAIVSIGGKEVLFDPGQPFCPPGELAWKHNLSGGIRQSNAGIVPIMTPANSFKQALTLRVAELQIAKDGAVSGSVKVTMAGIPAMEWRQRGLLAQNPEGVSQALGAQVGASLAPGWTLGSISVEGLADRAKPLVAQFEIYGRLAPDKAGELLIPASPLEAGSPQRMMAVERTTPIELDYAYEVEDKIKLTLVPELAVKDAPADALVSLGTSARFTTKRVSTAGHYDTTRILICGKASYGVANYPEIKEFYAKVHAEDVVSLVLASAK